ncbi:MAG TPA: BadF/BadG/BcrA/BcrD ATPase family protein [Candidatus Binatia bacterium]|nr:BadF/BadG/BcrA/BcrD ATPase family protein [Candidatus Binatia bacterium]
MSEDLILGIDGGGSKALIALADRSGRILEVSRGEGINPIDNRAWRPRFEAQLRQFSTGARLAAVAAAMPAYGEVEAISADQRKVIAEAFGGTPQRVLNDVDAAHIGAFAGGPGILILSGTGSMAWARDPAGRSYRVGGWGDTIGDEGSSHWIGRRVLSAVSRSIDGRAGATRLTDAVYEALGLDRNDPINGLVGWVARLDNARSGIASLAPVASRLAEAGDAAAIAIIEEAADALARHALPIARLAGIDTTWSYAGGTFGSRLLRDAVAARIGRPPLPPRLPPIGGALLAAAQHLDWSMQPNWIERLAASIEAGPAGNGTIRTTNTN